MVVHKPAGDLTVAPHSDYTNFALCCRDSGNTTRATQCFIQSCEMFSATTASHTVSGFCPVIGSYKSQRDYDNMFHFLTRSASKLTY